MEDLQRNDGRNDGRGDRTGTGAPFTSVLADVAALREHYAMPHQVVLDKVIGRLDHSCRAFIAASPFVVAATTSVAGECDASPRGGPPGFVRVLDDRRLALPDLNGNNRLDTLENVVTTGRIALLFLVPGSGEALRVNGRAWVTTDPEVLDLFTAELRRPVSAIGVEVDEAYVHCAKAVRRSGLWDPARWPASGDIPSGAGMLRAHLRLEATEAEILADLEASYAWGLEQDRPPICE